MCRKKLEVAFIPLILAMSTSVIKADENKINTAHSEPSIAEQMEARRQKSGVNQEMQDFNKQIYEANKKLEEDMTYLTNTQKRMNINFYEIKKDIALARDMLENWSKAVNERKIIIVQSLIKKQEVVLSKWKNDCNTVLQNKNPNMYQLCVNRYKELDRDLNVLKELLGKYQKM